MATLKLVPASGPPVEVDGDAATVGRDSSADVVVNDSSVSRKHARLERWGPKWAVVDQRSANGTFLDGQRVAESVLGTGQELRFGKVAYRVEIGGEEFGATVMMASPAVSEATVLQPAAPRPPAPRPSAPPAAPPPRPAAAPRAPYEAYPPEPAPTGKGPLFWILFGGLVLAALAAAVLFGGPFLKSRGAVEAARAQLKDIAGGDLNAAYARTVASYRATHSPSAFAAFVERHPGLKRNTDSTFKGRSVVNDKATISGTLTHPAGTEGVVYELVKEGEEWKVSGIELDGDEVEVGVASGPETGGLRIETLALNKVPQGQTVTVKIDVRVRGFDLRPEGNLFRVDLAEDLETFGADGHRIDGLSRVGLETYNQTTTSATDATATFSNTLTFSQPDPGRYRAVIGIRDMVGGKSKKHEIPFDLP